MRPDEGEPRTINQRMAALEAAMSAIRNELQTQRLVVADAAGRTRMVAEPTDEAFELRIEGATGPGDDEVTTLIFVVTAKGSGLPSGGGLQVWRSGSLLADMTAWEDE